jgi:hypothetical protein
MKNDYEIQIITIDVENNREGRQIAETLENLKFDSFTELKNFTVTAIGSEEEFNKLNLLTWHLTDFMDICNNEEINLDLVWIGYVRMKKL